jgi:type IV pilus assembly protein PilB
MNQRQLARDIAKRSSIPLRNVMAGIKTLPELITLSLQRGQDVRIVNFGTFEIVHYPSRTVRSPREPAKKIVMLAHGVPKFHPSGTFKARLRVKKIDASVPLEKEREAASPPPAAAPAPKAAAVLKQSIIEPISIPYVDLSKAKVSKEVLALIPEHIARLYQAVPVEKKGANTLVVAMIDPGDHLAIEFLKKRTGMTIEPRIATQNDIATVLDQYTGIAGELKEIVESATAEKKAKGAPEEAKSLEIEDLGVSAPAAKIVSSLIRRAVRDRGSDIHIEPSESEVVVRFRVDGVLRKVVSLPKDVQAAVISRIKILTNMKIDETRLPQDGRFQMIIDRGEVDFRVSTFPTVNGEKVVMRILDKTKGVLTLDQLGLRGRGFDVVSENIHKAHGMILVTGPTGSGKSTTLYAILDQLKSVTTNIITMEDPVEYRMVGINQGQVNAEIGFTFASGLRSILRQDPNVVMVGEIRDGETATMAVQAALTGHIVLSTLHTNDAAGAIPRLIDMGVEPFLITSSLNAVVAQRLTRTICEHCKAPVAIPQAGLDEVKKEIDALPKTEAEKMGGKNLTFYHGKGCDQCGDSGYRGRMGIFEVLPVTERIKQLTLERTGSSVIQEAAIKEGMLTLKQDGILKALEGLTTLEEVWRVTKD